MNYSLFVSAAKGLEYLLEAEMRALGLHVTRVNPQGVYGEASLTTLYQLCLWTRLANRVQLILFSGEAREEKALYRLCNQFHWQTLFTPDKTFAIEFHGSSDAFRNSMYGAQLVKDAIVDHFRSMVGSRPNVDGKNPDIRLHAHLHNDQLTLSYDLTGFSLHQRGYRVQAGEAPIKENIAAALLIRANWPLLATQGYGFLDPFCGAGTLVIEAAMMAANIAPGLLRHDQSFIHWINHDAHLWAKIRSQALEVVKPTTIRLQGSDANERLVSIAEANAKAAGVLPLVEFTHKDLKNCRPSTDKGLIACNPPYGERLGDPNQLIPLYQELGTTAFSHFQGWQLSFLTLNPMLAKSVGLRSDKQYTLFNGALECKLYNVSLNADNKLKNNASLETLSASAKMFANRLKKNLQHLQKWARRNEIHAYRVYDKDLPEYAYAIDIYNDYVILQEYKAPKDIDPQKAEKRRLEVMQVTPMALSVSADKLIIKERKQQKGPDQYQKIQQKQVRIEVQEGAIKCYVNLHDYLDTGLFLDHRPLRLQFANLPLKTRFLNCFCYTATASLHAAMGGAITTNVDMSQTYLTWAEDNFRLNQIDTRRHQFIQMDCIEWLKLSRDTFDVIFLDPPSFSNSKRMKETLDIQRDHVALINSAMHLLATDGVLYFSTNFRYFKLAPELEEKYKVKDISEETIDLDFKRNKRIHHCYRFMRG